MSTPSLKVLKLVSGDEIIGVVEDGAAEESDDKNFTFDNLLFVTNPMKIISEYDPNAKIHALYLVDWIPAIKDTVLPIDKQRVITLGDPNKQLENHYIDLVLVDKLYEQLAEAEAHGGLDEELTTEERETKRKLSDKLKTHKFEDDDIQ